MGSDGGGRGFPGAIALIGAASVVITGAGRATTGGVTVAGAIGAAVLPAGASPVVVARSGCVGLANGAGELSVPRLAAGDNQPIDHAVMASPAATVRAAA